MILKFVVISFLFLVILSQSISVQTSTDQKLIDQNTKLNNLQQSKDNSNNEFKQTQNNNYDNIVFTQVVHPEIKNVTKEVKKISGLDQQVDSSKVTKQQSVAETNITFTEITHPEIKNVTKEVKKIQDLKEQKINQTQIPQTTNNLNKSQQQQIKNEEKQQSISEQEKPKIEQIESKVSEQKQKQQIKIEQKSTISNESHSEQSLNQINPSQYQVVQQLYKRDKQFIAGSRFKSGQVSNVSSSKIKPPQQTFPQKWFEGVKTNKSSTTLIKQNITKSKQTEAPKAIDQKEKKITTPQSQQKLKPKSQPSLRTNNKQKIVVESNKVKQVQTISPPKQIVQQQIQTFALYKSVVLIIFSVVIFSLICVKIVNCAFNNQADDNSIKTRRDEDKQGLKFSQSELMRDPEDPVGDFIQISEDDENQD